VRGRDDDDLFVHVRDWSLEVQVPPFGALICEAPRGAEERATRSFAATARVVACFAVRGATRFAQRNSNPATFKPNPRQHPPSPCRGQGFDPPRLHNLESGNSRATPSRSTRTFAVCRARREMLRPSRQAHGFGRLRGARECRS
jgi:hypothetical protein